MGLINSHEDSYISSMLSTFTSTQEFAVDDQFWETFLNINFRQYVEKSSYASCILDEQELRLRRNYRTSMNMKTLVTIVCNKISNSFTSLESIEQVTNGLYVLRCFLCRILTASCESIVNLLGETCPSNDQGRWHHYLESNNFNKLLDCVLHSLLDLKVESKETYTLLSECASMLLTFFMMPIWEPNHLKNLYAYKCLLTASPDTAAKLLKNLLEYYIREHLSNPAEGIIVQKINDISWKAYIDGRSGYDHLGDTSLWLLLLLAHYPESSEGINIFNEALMACVNEEEPDVKTSYAAEVTEATSGTDSGLPKNDKEIIVNGDINIAKLDGIIVLPKGDEIKEANVGQPSRNSDHEIEGMENGLQTHSNEVKGGEGTSLLRKRSGSEFSAVDVEQLNGESSLKESKPNVIETEGFSFKLNLNDLFTSACCSSDEDGTVMIVYTLILRNKRIKLYFQTRDDIDLLIFSVLRKLYVTDGVVNSYSTYLSLCTLLMLSECGELCEKLHDYPTRDLSWYKERILCDVSLGSLVVLVLCRLLNINISKTRDDFVNENVLAILSNMSSYFKSLHPLACQQLVTIFEVVGRRFLRLQLDDEPNVHDELILDVESNYIIVLKDIMTTLLQIMDSCIVRRLSQNPNFVYSLLHKSSMFQRFMEFEEFQEGLVNLSLVWVFFNEKLSEHRQLTEDDILKEIKMNKEPFPYRLFRPIEDTKYQYIEDKNCPGFFLPYVSHIIASNTKLPINPELLPN